MTSCVERLRQVSVALCACAAVGCGAHDVSEARFAELRRALDDITRIGAYRCAPRELAGVRAQLTFADLELAQGNPQRADQHLTEAEANAGAARLLSPRERCGAVAVAPTAVAAETRVAGSLPDRDADGIADGDDRCPSAREDLDGRDDADGCPDSDDDADGIEDALDQCPREPEDRDGFQDGDGCPEPDNDGDGFQDPADDCPDVPGVPDNQGCPRRDYPGVVVTEKELRLTTPLVFERGTATIRSVSFPVLDSVARVLVDRPQLQVEIAGHTDSQGDDAKNLERSLEQAEGVKRALVERGVESSRLTARGYGETRPIESNSTSQGRAINRRIELIRTDRLP
jgi:OmpA-OmpF porin, OOP family